MQTADGAWRVEVVKRGRSRWYRIIHGDSELDWMSIAAVQRILGGGGIDIADLGDVSGQQPASGDDSTHRAAAATAPSKSKSAATPLPPPTPYPTTSTTPLEAINRAS
jgi:hypothetical protein